MRKPDFVAIHDEDAIPRVEFGLTDDDLLDLHAFIYASDCLIDSRFIFFCSDGFLLMDIKDGEANAFFYEIYDKALSYQIAVSLLKNLTSH